MSLEFDSFRALHRELLDTTTDRLREAGLDTDARSKERLARVIRGGVELMDREGTLGDAARVRTAQVNAAALGDLVAREAEARGARIIDEETIAAALSRCKYWPFCL